MKDTARNLLTTKEAVIHILDRSNVEAANQAAALLPAEQSELTVANFTPVLLKRLAYPDCKRRKFALKPPFTNMYRLTRKKPRKKQRRDKSGSALT